MKSLWDFAVELYQHQQIKTLCLELQDKFEVDVCLLLTMVWLAANNKAVDKQAMRELLHIIADWQQQISLPLRSLRMDIGGYLDGELANFSPNDNSTDVDHIYQQLKQVELAAERFALQRLEQAIVNAAWLPVSHGDSLPRGGDELLCANIQTYLQGFDLIEPAVVDKACGHFIEVV